jgi:hypothetical protein
MNIVYTVMRLILTPLLLSGCFAAHLPDTTEQAAPSSRNLSYFAVVSKKTPQQPNYYRSAGERITGTGSLGHQYLLFFPVTRLYLERGIEEYINELAVSEGGIVSNHSADELKALLGETRLNTFELISADLSLTARDYLFLRELIVNGKLSFSQNGGAPRIIKINRRLFSRTGSIAELSQLLTEAVKEAVTPQPGFQLHSTSGERIGSTLLVCGSNLPFLRGMEYALRENSRPFISFRHNCPRGLKRNLYRLSVSELTVIEEEELLSVDGTATLHEGEVAIASYPIKASIELLSISSAPDSRALEELGSRFIRENF